MALETLKAESDHLRGDLAAEWADTAAEAFSKDAIQLLKFHGSYQQDDRDVRRERLRAGLGRAHSLMVRASIPGGRLGAAQWLACDRVADDLGAGHLRITTRQGIQWHGVAKGDLKPLVRALHDELVTTIAACGDVARNTMGAPAPHADRPTAALDALVDEVSLAVRPRTPAYWDLWLDGERFASLLAPEPIGDLDDPVEPLYGPTYLPRKFKIGFAHPGDNDTDVYTQDIGVVAHPGPDGASIERVTAIVGGGQGMSHNNDATFPRLGDDLTTVPADELVELVATIIAVQRDEGDREDRKHARMKYLIDDRGLDWFRAEVERRLGRALPPAEPLAWGSTDDALGWHAQDRDTDTWFLGVRVASGRVVDTDTVRLRTVLRTLASEGLVPEFRLTPRQDVLLCGIAGADRERVDALLVEHGVVPVERLLPVARTALACPALPTCGLALAEAERALPDLLAVLEAELTDLGLEHEQFHVRMTGCPNGCARPYATEVGIVGRGKDHYALFLGGDAEGLRLNTPFADRVAFDRLGATLRPLLAAWRDEREDGEAFGTWCDRVGIPALQERFEVAA